LRQRATIKYHCTAGRRLIFIAPTGSQYHHADGRPSNLIAPTGAHQASIGTHSSSSRRSFSHLLPALRLYAPKHCILDSGRRSSSSRRWALIFELVPIVQALIYSCLGPFVPKHCFLVTGRSSSCSRRWALSQCMQVLRRQAPIHQASRLCPHLIFLLCSNVCVHLL